MSLAIGMDDPEFLLNRGTVGLTQYGNDAKEFARETLAPLIKEVGSIGV